VVLLVLSPSCFKGIDPSIFNVPDTSGGDPGTDGADAPPDELEAEDGDEDGPVDEPGAGDAEADADAPVDELEAGDAPLDEPGSGDADDGRETGPEVDGDADDVESVGEDSLVDDAAREAEAEDFAGEEAAGEGGAEDVSLDEPGVEDTPLDEPGAEDAPLDEVGAEESGPCPEGMALVPAGPFVMGSDEGEGGTDEQPEHVVTLSAYCIDLTEVTEAQYRACMSDGACERPPGWSAHGDDYPMNVVSWNGARTYCEWAGKALPTEAQWEKAARGGCEVVEPSTCGGEDERTFPWGDERAECDRANRVGCADDIDAVAMRPSGASPYGAHDMAGNVSEWVADWYAADTYAGCVAGCTDPEGPATGSERGVHGGCFGSTLDYLRLATRDRSGPSASYYFVGWRCARAAAP
jgi:formylglycine-generating enzyme required for sulfatase activity